MMGRCKGEQGQLFYAFELEAVVPDDHQVRQIAAVLDLSWVRVELAPHLLQHWSALGRSRADDPDAHPWLRIRGPLGARTMPRGSAQSRLSLVLRPWHRRQDPGSLGIHARPQRALSRS